MIRLPAPTFDHELRIRSRGYRLIAGVDEVGRGALAGPVVAAAIILSPDHDMPWLQLVRDSKQLSPKQRENVFEWVQRAGIPVGLGSVSHTVIDEVGIVRATRMAMCQAVEALPCRPDFLMIDALSLPEVSLPQKGIIRGDQLSLTIACASIVAKVDRDRQMEELDGKYPGYGLARHKGYGTRHHLQRLCQLGPCAIHRRSFAPVLGVSLGTKRRDLGMLGERWAKEYLQRKGYEILETNYRCREGEIDIIARHENYLVFVEVRTKSGSQFGTPEESVTATKQQKLISVAMSYLQDHNELPIEWRIDVVAVEVTTDGQIVRTELIQNAIS